MGIEQLIFEGPHYPHVQQIQDLIEYPQTESEAVAASPPYEGDTSTPDDSTLSGETMQRRYGAIQSQENRDRSYEEDEEGDVDYFEEDEFLDYYADMQYLKQSEQQILAIFTDHIMNSMLDEVLAVVQRHFPRKVVRRQMNQ